MIPAPACARREPAGSTSQLVPPLLQASAHAEEPSTGPSWPQPPRLCVHNRGPPPSCRRPRSCASSDTPFPLAASLKGRPRGSCGPAPHVIYKHDVRWPGAAFLQSLFFLLTLSAQGSPEAGLGFLDPPRTRTSTAFIRPAAHLPRTHSSPLLRRSLSQRLPPFMSSLSGPAPL